MEEPTLAEEHQHLAQDELPEPLFQGEYTHSLDAKGRLTIPAELRPPLTQGMQLTRGFELCIIVLTQEAWRKLAQEAARLPTVYGEVRDNNRLVFGAAKATLDSMGRILLPEHLRKHARIDGQAVIVGVNDKIEIWNPDVWDEHVTGAIGRSPEINAVTAKLGMTL
jgi:MraZ protein